MSSQSQAAAEKEVRTWGFETVYTWTDRPNAHYAPHKHAGLTTHLILRGRLTATFPDDPEPTKQSFVQGDRFDVGAGQSHEVWVGKEGCTYVIGDIVLSRWIELFKREYSSDPSQTATGVI